MIQTTRSLEHLDSHTLNVFVEGELPLGEQERIRPHVEHSHIFPLHVFSPKELKAAIVSAGLRSDPYATDTAKVNHIRNGNLVYFDSQLTFRAAVNQLLSILREVLLLCDVKERSPGDIALILEILVGTVMSGISGACETLCQLPIPQHWKSQ